MPQPTPVTNSRLPWIAIAIWALILALIVGTAVAFAGHDASPAANSGVGANGNPLTALLPQADPNASPAASAPAGQKPDRNGNRKKGPGPFGLGLRPGLGFGPSGPGGPGGAAGPGNAPANGKPGNPDANGVPSAGRGPISITAISGSQLSLKTPDGWTRTIDATGATIKRGDQTLTVADLKVGDEIRFRQTRNADGTFKITEIAVIQPVTGGTVKTVAGNTVTLTLRDGTAKAITVTDATTYSLGNKAGTKADVKPGVIVVAQGTIGSDGTFTATRVVVTPAFALGVVTAKTASTITIKSWNSTTITLNVTAATTYQARGKTAAALADVLANNIVQAEGTLNPDGSLNATTVRIFPTGNGMAPFRGGGGGIQKPNPSPNATATSG